MRKPFNGNYPITQNFGQNPADYARFGLAGHNGTDYGLPAGTSVVAAQPGFMTVLSDPGGFGNYVLVDGGGFRTLYAHLTRATTSGNVVEGQEIAISGNTGNSTGPHLHFGVRPVIYSANNGYNGYIDPQGVINKGGDDLIKPEDRDTVRIINSEVAGWDFGKVHTGAYDDQELKAWVGQPWTKLIQEKWAASDAFRTKRNTLFTNGVQINKANIIDYLNNNLR